MKCESTAQIGSDDISPWQFLQKRNMHAIICSMSSSLSLTLEERTTHKTVSTNKTKTHTKKLSTQQHGSRQNSLGRALKSLIYTKPFKNVSIVFHHEGN